MRVSRAFLDLAEPNDFGAIRQAFEIQLRELVTGSAAAPPNLRSAMSHALLAPSKRVRPVVLYLMTEPSDEFVPVALRAGAAVEMAHTASLIFDDLPCMDNAEMRRHRPTTHLEFGEATAILGAIALLSQAFHVLSGLEGVPASTRARLTSILSKAVGWDGLAAGQEMDINGGGIFREQQEIEKMNWLKTGALFEASAEMGAVLGDRGEAEVEEARRFAMHFGLAYQALDDLRDGAASAAEAGKDVNKDKNRVTLVTRFGSRQARQTCQQHLKLADAALMESGVTAAPLRALMSQLFHGWTPG